MSHGLLGALGGARWPELGQNQIIQGSERELTNGRPQYVHVETSGLSTLIKTLGCPNGPPPPSHSTTRLCVHLMGCLWIRPIAASGRGYEELESESISRNIIEFNADQLRRGVPYLSLHDSLLESRP